MANQLEKQLKLFCATVQDCKLLANNAHSWTTPSSKHRVSRAVADSMVELAFLRASIAWESFLEESFILFLIGKNAPVGRPPKRYVLAPNIKFLREKFLPEGREYATWNEDNVRNRSERFFANGYVFLSSLRSRQNKLEEARKIRNAIAHGTNDCWNKFLTIVRDNLTTVPANITIGKFLDRPVPPSILMVPTTGQAPTTCSFLELYLNLYENIANLIVRT